MLYTGNSHYDALVSVGDIVDFKSHRKLVKAKPKLLQPSVINFFALKTSNRFAALANDDDDDKDDEKTTESEKNEGEVIDLRSFNCFF